MVKKMLINWKIWCCSRQKKHNTLILKLCIGTMFVVLALRLILSRFSSFSQVSETPFLDEAVYTSSPSPFSSALHHNASDSADQFLPKEENEGTCDVLIGDWVPSPSGPSYTNDTCKFIEDHQNCMTNGRPDTNYLYWRWIPRDCTLPQLDPKRFLEMMRSKTWGLIGDSISRNHVQSLLCILSKVEEAVEVYHDELYKNRGWRFPSYNFTISVLWSPFLAEAAIFEDYNGVSTHEVELQLDKLDMNWTEHYKSLDYIILSTGKWFMKSAIYYENNTVLGCHNCPERNMTEMDFDYAYHKVLKGIFDFIVSSDHKGMIFYRTCAPDHFENGDWNSGGNCKRNYPVKHDEFNLNEVNRKLREIELDEFEKASGRASRKGVNLKLLDVNPLSLLRPDGHPGPYRFFHPMEEGKDSSNIINDCLHWCLPGPIDSWNDLLMKMILNG